MHVWYEELTIMKLNSLRHYVLLLVYSDKVVGLINANPLLYHVHWLRPFIEIFLDQYVIFFTILIDEIQLIINKQGFILYSYCLDSVSDMHVYFDFPPLVFVHTVFFLWTKRYCLILFLKRTLMFELTAIALRFLI